MPINTASVLSKFLNCVETVNCFTGQLVLQPRTLQLQKQGVLFTESGNNFYNSIFFVKRSIFSSSRLLFLQSLAARSTKTGITYLFQFNAAICREGSLIFYRSLFPEQWWIKQSTEDTVSNRTCFKCNSWIFLRTS